MNEKKKKRSPFLNGIIWSTRGISNNITNTLIVSYLSFYATDVLGMKATLIATVLLLTRLFDGGTDIISGFIIDNTRSKYGKGRPYDFCMIFIGIFTVLLFSAPKASTMVQAVYLAVMYILVQAVFVTLLNTADSVYLLRAFPEEKERNNVFGISSVFAQVINITIGVILPVFIASAGTDRGAWTRIVFMLAIPFALLGMVRFFLIKEQAVVEPEKHVKQEKKDKVGLVDGIKAIVENKYVLILTLGIFIIVICSGFLNTSMPYYFKYIVGDTSKMSIASMGSYASLLMLVIFVPVANKFGKCKVMKFGLAVAALGCAIRWFGGANMTTMVIGMALLMFGVMPISVYFPLYLFDIMDYGEWKTGKRVEGLYAAFPTFANKVAGGISVSLGVFILGLAGYDGAAEVQTASALNAINLTFNVIPTVLLVVMALLMFSLYNIDNKMPQVKEDLKKRHEKQQTQAAE